MISTPDKKVFPLGLVLFALVLAAYKAIMLAVEMGAGGQTLLVLLGLDLFFISLLLLTAILQALLSGSATAIFLRFILRSVLVVVTGVYLVDSFVLLALDDHAGLFDIGRYAPEWGVVLSFFDAPAYTAIALFLLSVFYVQAFTPASRKFSLALLATIFIWGVLSTANAPQTLARYAMLSPAGLLQEFRSPAADVSYSAREMKFYAGLKREDVEVPASRPDIILVLVESLSSIHSKKTSGRGDLLDRFDELAEDGLLFTNFFANHQASEGAIIALLSGFPPMHFPTATPYMFDEFALQGAVINAYRQQGYFTEFLTNSDLSFIGLDHYLAGIGIDRSRGRDEVEAMRNAPRMVQNAPADDVLYAEAFSTVQQLSLHRQPFLLVLATTSTHLPYAHPLGGLDTAQAVWDWSLQQLTAFYRHLSQAGYFEQGVLLVTGDHRQMRPLSRMETDRYGDSARARVPLLLIGKDYPRGAIDERFFQQSDLLRMLASIPKPDVQLSPQPIWVERYNRKYGQVQRMDKLSIFDQQNQGRTEYPLRVLGNHIDWLEEKPVFARSLEIRIHTQRSAHQQTRNGTAQGCRPQWADHSPVPSVRHGLELGIFNRPGLDGVMDMRSLPARSRQVLETVALTGFADLAAGSVVLFNGFIDIEETGVYRFRVAAGQTACMSLDKKLLLDQHANTALNHEISVELTAGLHFLDLRLTGRSLRTGPVLEWVKPGTRQWRWTQVPAERFLLAAPDLQAR